MTPPKTRLDLALVARGITQTRQQARALIMSGKVLVDDCPADKPGIRVTEACTIHLRGAPPPYASRGGLKLEGALQAFGIDPRGWICLDVGASTGGFTDCLLQHGAAAVYAVDVGYGQLAWKLRTDPRVKVIERTNIRFMKPEAIPQPVDLATVDVSFISLKLVIPEIVRFTKPTARIVALVKPQFEVGKGMVGKGGVVRNPKLHTAVVADLADFFQNLGVTVRSVVPSAVRGPKGNVEFFFHLTA